MRISLPTVASLTFLAVVAGPALAGSDSGDSDYHGDPMRTGNFVAPTLTQASAATTHRDTGFVGKITGTAYGQPLYYKAPGADHGAIIVATDKNVVTALDTITGLPVWQTPPLGPPAVAVTPLCQPKKATGITGTPVIDPVAGALYLDANVQVNGAARHLVYGLSLVDGSVLPGWPIDVGTGLAAIGQTFQPEYQGQRPGLALIDGVVYVAYGGNHGDCGPYHGWVVGLSTAVPGVVAAWSSRIQHAGIWSQGGLVTDGESFFVTTGNGQRRPGWQDQEGVFRLGPSLAHSVDTHDYYYPSNFPALDKADLDLGGTAPVPVDVPAGDGVTTLSWLVQFGKDGNAYLLDRTNLGGQDGALLVQQVTNGEIITGPATLPAPDGAFIAIQGNGMNCPAPITNVALVMLKVSAQPSPSITTSWCASLLSTGSPTITTTDGVSNPVVWMPAVHGDRMLHAWAGDTGAPLFAGGGVKMGGLQNFVAVLPAEGHLFVGGGNVVYSFSYIPNQ